MSLTLPWRLTTLALCLALGALGACGSETGGAAEEIYDPEPQGAGFSVLPGDPGWVPVTPPAEGICIGANPGEAAFELSRTIAAEAALAALEAEAEADTTEGRGDASEDASDDATSERDVTLSADFNFPSLPMPSEEEEAPEEREEPPADDEAADPCIPDYQDAEGCFGVEAPAFAAYDFQPQSCGFGATYGLDVFKGRVTFVALFASW